MATSRGRGSLLAIMVVATAMSATLGLQNAWANGGETIAQAPQLPLNQQTASGYVQKQPEPIQGEYWRVEMPAGALLTFDGTVTSTCGDNNHHPEAYIYVFPPSMTDYTRRETSGVTDAALNPNGELRFTAPYSGNWLLNVGIGGASCGDFAYTFTATVQVPTHATLIGPRATHSGASISLTGSVAGITHGSATIAVRGRHHWTTIASGVPIASGIFHWKGRAGDPGTYTYRVSYSGNSGHLPSSAQHTLIVR
jgi:hypothetical protein